MTMYKNWVTTLGGIMAGLGTIPMLVTASHIGFPLWWNDCQFPLYLTGFLGTVLLGLAAKGADQHSTPAQIQAADLQSKVQQVALDADAAAKPTTPSKVIVEPPAKP